MTKFASYWAMILKKSWKDTRHDFRLETNARIIVAVLIWASALIFSFEKNHDAFSFSTETQGTWKWLMIVSCLFPVWILIRALIACATVDQDLRAKFVALDDTKKIRHALVRLADLRIKMVEIYRQKVSSDTEFEKVQTDFHEAMQKSYDLIMQDISHARANVFITPPVYQAALIVGSFNQEHSNFRLVVNNKAEALYAIIRDYELKAT